MFVVSDWRVNKNYSSACFLYKYRYVGDADTFWFSCAAVRQNWCLPTPQYTFYVVLHIKRLLINFICQDTAGDIFLVKRSIIVEVLKKIQRWLLLLVSTIVEDGDEKTRGDCTSSTSEHGRSQMREHSGYASPHWLTRTVLEKLETKID